MRLIAAYARISSTRGICVGMDFFFLCRRYFSHQKRLFRTPGEEREKISALLAHGRLEGQRGNQRGRVDFEAGQSLYSTWLTSVREQKR